MDGVIHRFEGHNAAVWGSLGPVLPCFGQGATPGGDWPAWGPRVETGSRSRQEAATGGTGWQYAPTTGRSSERREQDPTRVPWTGTDTSRTRYARMRAREGADRAGPRARVSPPALIRGRSRRRDRRRGPGSARGSRGRDRPFCRFRSATVRRTPAACSVRQT